MASESMSVIPPNERGASAVEYALLLAGIAALIIVVVFAFGPVLQDMFGDTCDKYADKQGQPSCARS